MHYTSHVVEIVGGVVALLLVAAGILAATKRLRLPFTVVLVLVGIVLAQLARTYPQHLGMLAELSISPDLILYVFLPTLVFESAYNLDARALRNNLGSVLLLAVPGLLLSTFLIGFIVSWATPIPLTAALLLGAILSATDPVAVVALFRQLGAPQRLMLLVEGESLFNDATAIVVARILIGVIAAGSISASTLAGGAVDFVALFVGGLLVGLALGLIAGYLLGKVVNDPAIEITLTTVLAYLSFLLAEEVFHVSGVMAVVAAGVVLGVWGRMRVTPAVRNYLTHFWEYIAFVANALIFLMVGLTVQLSAVWAMWDLLLWVIGAMLLSRAAMIYGLMPWVGRLYGGQPVSWQYQTVMFWGGLRGAIALAIVLSLPASDFTQTFVALVTGAVLFTLLVQGLSIEWLMHRLRLDQLPLSDRLVRLEARLDGKQRALERVPELQRGGLFSPRIAEQQLQQCQAQSHEVLREIAQLRQTELDADQEKVLLYLRCFAEEKAWYVDMFNKGHLSERAYRELVLNLTLEVEALRHHGDFHGVHMHRMGLRRFERALFRWLDRLGLSRLAERWRRARVAVNYEESWGHYQSSDQALVFLEQLAGSETIPGPILDEVRASYTHWHYNARRQLDQMAEQYPEFVAAMQERLGQRLVLIAEQEVIAEQRERGVLPLGIAESAEYEVERKLNSLRGQEPSRLVVDPAELLRKVPFFRDFPRDEFDVIATSMRAHTVGEDEDIVRQGAAGDSLFLIARGVVRISYERDGASHDVATLMAGDFFGEMALLHREPRTATVRAVTPATLYELGRQDLNRVIEKHPSVRTALQETDRQRRAVMTDLDGAVEPPL